MNKTINVNIGGFSFTLDEEAYNRLKDYLDALRRHFSREEGTEEIMRDIEARLAEMLMDALGKRQVVGLADVQDVIKQMGTPEDFEIPQDGPQGQPAAEEESTERRFYRNTDDAVLGGVCSGISAYFNVDPIWLRIAFVVGLFVFGGGLLLYLILWIIIPEAKTAADRLRMRGKRANISNIEETVRSGLRDAREGINRAVPNVRSGFERFIDRFGGPIIKLVGLFFVAVAIFALAGVVIAIVAGGSVFAISFPMLKHHLLVAGWQQSLATFSVLLVIGIPLLLLLVKGIRTLMGLKFKSRLFNVTMLLAWLTGLGFGVAVAVDLGTDFSRGGSYRFENVLHPTGKTIVVKPSGIVPHRAHNHHELDIDFEGSTWSEDSLSLSKVSLAIAESDDSTTSLVATLFARGRTKQVGIRRASTIEHHVQMRDSTLYIDPWLTSGGEPWRGQRVELTLKVPRGQSVRVSRELSYMLVEDLTHDRGNQDAVIRF